MRLLALFQPKPTLSDKETAHGLRLVTLEGMASNGFTSITTSGFLTAFALALGANNFQIGILAAIPFILQLIQIPTIWFVEKVRRRKAIAVSTWFIAQLLWFPMALIPIFTRVPGAGAISMLLGLMAVRSVFLAVTNCSWNSWMRDLVPRQILGRFFSRRLALSTTVAAIFGLGGAFFVDYWRGTVSPDSAALGYTFTLLFGAFFLGMASPIIMSFQPEPLMQTTIGTRPSLWDLITRPLREKNFRQLMRFLLLWSLALNLAVPFFAVYMLQQLGLPLSLVIGLGVLGQFFTILFLRVWGPLADRFGSKAVLSLCASLYLIVILGWTFTGNPYRYFLSIPLLVVLSIFAGIATAGVSLTIATINFKLAPREQSASFLAGASLSTNLGAGLGPLLGGLLANFFSSRQLRLDLTWIDPSHTLHLGVINLAGFDFLFILTFIFGLIILNLLTALREEGEADKEVVLNELKLQARMTFRSAIPVTSPNFIDMFPLSFLNRVPGIDVAIGVTAYQLANTARTVTATASHGSRTAVRIARALQDWLDRLWETGNIPPQHDREVARQAARGALHAAEDTKVKNENLAGPVVIGIVRAMDEAHVNPYDAIHGAAYGVIEGASEVGTDLGRATTEAIAGARDTARDLNLNKEEAVQQATRGAIEAATRLGPEAVARVKEVLQNKGQNPDVIR